MSQKQTFPNGLGGLVLHLLLAILGAFLFLYLAGSPLDGSPWFLAQVVGVRLVLLVLEVPLIALPLAFSMKRLFLRKDGKTLRPGLTRQKKITLTLTMLAIFLPVLSYIDCMLFLRFMGLDLPQGTLHLTGLSLLANLPGTVCMIADLVKKIRMLMMKGN